MAKKQVEKPMKQEKLKMSKGQGWLIFGMLLAGILFLWASISSYVNFVLSLALMFGAYVIYAHHVKKGGITVQEAWKAK